jgi:hypothetical protein
MFRTDNSDGTLSQAEVNEQIAAAKVLQYGRFQAVFDASVKAIGDAAFYGRSALVSTTIPSSVANIGSRAFWNCINLSEVYFDGDEPLIGSGAFDGIRHGAAVYVYQYAKSFPGLEQLWNGLIIRYRGDLIAYQYLPFSLALPTSDGSGWIKKGYWPKGLEISMHDTSIRKRGEIYGAPTEYGVFDVTVQAVDENNEPADGEMTFTIDIEQKRTQAKLNEANAFTIVQPLGAYDDAEEIYVVDVYDTDPDDVDIIFAYNNIDFIGLWIDGEFISQESDYHIQTIQDQSGITSIFITVYGHTIARLDPSVPHVLAGEFKAGGAANGRQYVIAQNFIINVIPKPIDHDEDVDVDQDSNDDEALITFGYLYNTDNPKENTYSYSGRNPSESSKLENFDKATNISISIPPAPLSDVRDGTIISDSQQDDAFKQSNEESSASMAVGNGSASFPNGAQLQPSSAPSTSVAKSYEPSGSLESNTNSQLGGNNNNNRIYYIIFGAIAMCSCAFISIVALRRWKSRKNS